MRPAARIKQNAFWNGAEIVILEANAVYAVFCDGQPINYYTETIRGDRGETKLGIFDEQTLNAPTKRKYLRTSFPNKGHAYLLSEKLNEAFMTTEQFTVWEIKGHTVTQLPRRDTWKVP